MRNIRDMYGHVYIFLTRKQKQKDLANVRLSIRPSARQCFNDFSILRNLIDIIDSGFFILMVCMDYKIKQDPIGPDRTKISEFAAEIKLFLAYLGDKIK